MPTSFSYVLIIFRKFDETSDRPPLSAVVAEVIFPAVIALFLLFVFKKAFVALKFIIVGGCSTELVLVLWGHCTRLLFSRATSDFDAIGCTLAMLPIKKGFSLR